MPDFAVASSKRIRPGLGAACASAVEDRRISRRTRGFMLVSSCALRGCPGHVSGRGGFQQGHGHRVFWSSFGTGVASYTSTLLTPAHPEESRLAFQSLAGSIEQFDLQRLIVRNLHKKRAVGLNWRGAKQRGISSAVSRVDPHGTDRARLETAFRGVRVQAE